MSKLVIHKWEIRNEQEKKSLHYYLSISVWHEKTFIHSRDEARHSKLETRDARQTVTLFLCISILPEFAYNQTWIFHRFSSNSSTFYASRAFENASPNKKYINRNSIDIVIFRQFISLLSIYLFSMLSKRKSLSKEIAKQLSNTTNRVTSMQKLFINKALGSSA